MGSVQGQQEKRRLALHLFIGVQKQRNTGLHNMLIVPDRRNAPVAGVFGFYRWHRYCDCVLALYC